MDREKAVDFVVRELGKHHTHNEIIVTLCEKMGFAWKDAEKFVHEVELQEERRIAMRQSPITLVLGIGTVFVGIVLLVNAGLFFMRMFPELGSELSLTKILNLRYAYFQIGEVFTGLAMMVGGSVGSFRVLAKMLK